MCIHRLMCWGSLTMVPDLTIGMLTTDPRFNTRCGIHISSGFANMLCGATVYRRTWCAHNSVLTDVTLKLFIVYKHQAFGHPPSALHRPTYIRARCTENNLLAHALFAKLCPAYRIPGANHHR